MRPPDFPVAIEDRPEVRWIAARVDEKMNGSDGRPLPFPTLTELKAQRGEPPFQRRPKFRTHRPVPSRLLVKDGPATALDTNHKQRPTTHKISTRLIIARPKRLNAQEQPQ